jgi:hypothetical protein
MSYRGSDVREKDAVQANIDADDRRGYLETTARN